MLLRQSQHEGKHLFMHHVGQTIAYLAQAGVVGRRFGGQEPQELLQRPAIAAAPGNAQGDRVKTPPNYTNALEMAKRTVLRFSRRMTGTWNPEQGEPYGCCQRGSDQKAFP